MYSLWLNNFVTSSTQSVFLFTREAGASGVDSSAEHWNQIRELSYSIHCSAPDRNTEAPPRITEKGGRSLRG